ncbi:MAG: hypothetical protein A4S14_05550 [Proteobacteria bacterium SG_bin9]|nr:MAG: hypothetical protein A4S14_05550 [Proteobacteria bacterium SG_bin9]
MKRILLLGKNGQVGRALQTALPKTAVVMAHDRTTCDLSSPDHLRRTIRDSRPDIVINAAAYTAVDHAETDPDACFQINASAPAVIAEEAKRLDALLVHYSTDYVFDGRKPSPYVEGDAPNPLNAYGRSKLQGDQAVVAAGGRHIILRVAWVYSATGKNFAKTILRLAAERDELRIVSDQHGTPTSADQIATATSSIIEKIINSRRLGADHHNGVYHLAPKGVTSWHGFASELISVAQQYGIAMCVQTNHIIPIAAKEYPTPAQRPGNSVLDTTKLQRELGVSLPDWRESVRAVVVELARPTERTAA